MAVAVAALVLASGCQASSSQNVSVSTNAAPSPTPLPAASAGSLGFITALALTGQAVFALYAPNGTEGQLRGATSTMLARLDRSSGAVLTTGPFSGAMTIAATDSWVWIGGGNDYLATPNPNATGLIRLNAKTLSNQLSIRLPDAQVTAPAMVQLAAWDQRVWLAYGRRIYLLTAATGAVLASSHLPGIASSLAYEPSTSKLYVGSDAGSNQTQATVSERDPADLHGLVTASTGGADLGGPDVTPSQSDIWIAFATGMLGQVEHRRASDLALEPMANHPQFTNGVRVFAAGRQIWVSDSMAGKLDCLDPASGAVRASRDLVQGGIVVGDAAGVYLGAATGLSVLAADPRC